LYENVLTFWNTSEGTLPYVSPLAQAMMDSERGNAVRVGSLNAKIIEIS
jgi:hypothetical protein